MNERIKQLRNKLKLSQSAFGERLGVSRDMVNNLERGRVDIKDHIVKLISSEYGVNEDWLRYGTEPMYIQPEVFSLDDFAKEREATPLEIEAIKAYFDLDPSIRKMLVQHFKKRLFSDNSDEIPDTAAEFEEKYPTIENAGENVNDVG